MYYIIANNMLFENIANNIDLKNYKDYFVRFIIYNNFLTLYQKTKNLKR